MPLEQKKLSGNAINIETAFPTMRFKHSVLLSYNTPTLIRSRIQTRSKKYHGILSTPVLLQPTESQNVYIADGKKYGNGKKPKRDSKSKERVRQSKKTRDGRQRKDG